jgi:hypothetical protein
LNLQHRLLSYHISVFSITPPSPRPKRYVSEQSRKLSRPGSSLSEPVFSSPIFISPKGTVPATSPHFSPCIVVRIVYRGLLLSHVPLSSRDICYCVSKLSLESSLCSNVARTCDHGSPDPSPCFAQPRQHTVLYISHGGSPIRKSEQLIYLSVARRATISLSSSQYTPLRKDQALRFQRQTTTTPRSEGAI